MARIRHIALLTKDTEKLSEFYKSAFGLKEVARSGEPSRSASRPASHEPRARPPMNTLSTVETARVVEPNSSVRARTQLSS